MTEKQDQGKWVQLETGRVRDDQIWGNEVQPTIFKVMCKEVCADSGARAKIKAGERAGKSSRSFARFNFRSRSTIWTPGTG